MLYKHVCIESFGYELPPHIITSAAIEDKLAPLYDKLKLPYGRLEMMSGIRERRFWDEGAMPSQVAAKAGANALRNSCTQADEIECLLHTSVCRDMLEPATATLVHRALGLAKDCTIYDISNACLGFLNGMVTLANMIELGQVKKGMIVSGESSRQLVETTIQSLLNKPNPTREDIKEAFASLTIGSGACALVMAHDSVSKFKHHLLGGAVRCATEFNHLCRGNAGNMNTDSETLLQEGCKLAKYTWQKTQEILGWTNNVVDRVFCHQVGAAHRKLLYKSLELDQAKDFSTVEYLGNTGSASLPTTMAIGIEKAPPPPDTNIAMLGIGSGLNCLMLGVKW
ncbi:MAG TPA: 3-oxoacyl-ACP synthase III [Planctomycetota bacterium]|nr:3-oxoacyl-ACP synthase III [Planctomycetota bacterium]